MPPKPKFTRDEIVAAALELVSRRGTSALTARELGAALGSSARPIFTVFRSMEEVQLAVREAAMHRFEAYAARTVPAMPRFKQVGMQMVLFGVHEPKLYQLLFMQEGAGGGFDELFAALGSTADECIRALCADYALDEGTARSLFENMWIYTFGVGALCATRVCAFREDELGALLTTQFNALMAHFRPGKG